MPAQREQPPRRERSPVTNKRSGERKPARNQVASQPASMLSTWNLSRIAHPFMARTDGSADDRSPASRLKSIWLRAGLGSARGGGARLGDGSSSGAFVLPGPFSPSMPCTREALPEPSHRDVIPADASRQGFVGRPAGQTTPLTAPRSIRTSRRNAWRNRSKLAGVIDFGARRRIILPSSASQSRRSSRTSSRRRVIRGACAGRRRRSPAASGGSGGPERPRGGRPGPRPSVPANRADSRNASAAACLAEAMIWWLW